MPDVLKNESANRAIASHKKIRAGVLQKQKLLRLRELFTFGYRNLSAPGMPNFRILVVQVANCLL